MSKFHWSTDRTAELGEHILTHSLDEARFAIYGDGLDLVDPDGAWKRLQDWWNSIPSEQRKYLRASGEINWWEIVDAVLRGQGQPREYFSEFVDDPFTLSFRMNDGQSNHKCIWYDVSGEAGSYLYDTDTLKIVYRDVSSKDGDEVITSFEFAIPERTTVAYFLSSGLEKSPDSPRNRLFAEFLPHALLTLARMGFSIIRWETHQSTRSNVERAIEETGGRWLSLPDGRYQKDRVLVWWSLRSYDSSKQAEKALWGAREANRTDSGFHFSEVQFGRPYGETWHIIYQTGYDDTYSQVNMDYMIKQLEKLDPDGEWWQIEWYSGMGTGRMLVVRAYDDAGNLSEVYQQVREWTDYVRDRYPLLDEDEFFKREWEYTKEQIREKLGNAQLKDGVKVTDELVLKVAEELSEGGWDTGNIDDFVLEDELVNTVLHDLQVLDETDLDPIADFMPWGWSEQREWKKGATARRWAKPETVRVDVEAVVGNPRPTLPWKVNGSHIDEVEHFEVRWYLGDEEHTVTTTDTSVTVEIPIELGNHPAIPELEVWFRWSVRAKLKNNWGYTDWTSGWSYSLRQALTGQP